MIEKLDIALVLATYVITLVGVCIGFITALYGFLVTKQKQQIETFKNNTENEISNLRNDIEKKLKEFSVERLEYRTELKNTLIAADRITLIEIALGEFVRYVTLNKHCNGITLLSDYHTLYSNLLGIVSDRSEKRLAECLSYLGNMAGSFGEEFDCRIVELVRQLWCDGYFHHNQTDDKLEAWYTDIFGSEFGSLPRVSIL